jgi:hypothetical protein
MNSILSLIIVTNPGCHDTQEEGLERKSRVLEVDGSNLQRYRGDSRGDEGDQGEYRVHLSVLSPVSVPVFASCS